MNPADLAFSVADLVLEKDFTIAVPSSNKLESKTWNSTVSDQDINQILGVYLCPDIDLHSIVITKQNETINLEFLDNTVEITPISPTHFCSCNSPIDIILDFQPEIGKALIQILNWSLFQEFTKINTEPIPLEKLASIVGEYYSEELQAIQKIYSSEGQLYLVAGSQEFQLDSPSTR